MRREYIIFGGIVAVILLLLIAPKLNKEKPININDIISEEPVENQEELMSELLREDRKYTEEVTNIVKEPTKSEDNISPPTKTTGGTSTKTKGTSTKDTGGTDTSTENTEDTVTSTKDKVGTDTSAENIDNISQDGPSEEMPKEFSKTWDNVVALLCKHYVCKTLPEDYMIFLSDKGKENYSLVSPDKKLKPQFIYDYNVDRDKQLVVITTDKSEVIKFKYYLTDDLVDNIERLKK